jgi:hypothetical protein
MPHHGDFIPVKEPQYPLSRRLVGPKSSVERREKLWPSLRLEPHTVWSIASFHTNYTAPAPKNSKWKGKNQDNKNISQVGE